MKLIKIHFLAIIILLSFLVRFFPLEFPVFTSDEARLAFRGYALSSSGKDELGRSFPVFFNSSDDYQLPVVSYLTASGTLVFGKTDLGVRMPFILIGSALVFLIYKLSGLFFGKKEYSLFGAVIACFSPGLIFFSKFPNEFIVVTFLSLVLIIQLFKERVSGPKIFVIVLLMLLTSKIVWFVLMPIFALTLFLNNTIKKKEKINLLIFCFILNLAAIVSYLNVPQGARSLMENYFPVVNDVTIKNGIEKSRSQAVSGWPIILNKILFNKAYLVIAGLFHWLSQLSLSNLFAEIDNTGQYGFLKLGAFPKVTIVPFLIGLFVLARQSGRVKFLILYILLITFPALFLYPLKKIEFILPALPFIVLISALGFKFLNRKIALVLVGFLILETLVNLAFIPASIKNANEYRPDWVKKIILDGYSFSSDNNIAFSDNITKDIVPFIEWYTNFDPKKGYEDIKFPYKFSQTKISNIKIIGSEDTFYNCSFDKPTYIFATQRDLKKIQRDIRVIPVGSYKNSLGEDVVYLFQPRICVH